MDTLFVEKDTVDEGRIFDRSTLTLFDLDIGEVNEPLTFISKSYCVNRSNTDICHEGLDRTCRLTSQRSLGDFKEDIISLFG